MNLLDSQLDSVLQTIHRYEPEIAEKSTTVLTKATLFAEKLGLTEPLSSMNSKIQLTLMNHYMYHEDKWKVARKVEESVLEKIFSELADRQVISHMQSSTALDKASCLVDVWSFTSENLVYELRRGVKHAAGIHTKYLTDLLDELYREVSFYLICYYLNALNTVVDKGGADLVVDPSERLFIPNDTILKDTLKMIKLEVGVLRLEINKVKSIRSLGSETSDVNLADFKQNFINQLDLVLQFIQFGERWRQTIKTRKLMLDLEWYNFYKEGISVKPTRERGFRDLTLLGKFWDFRFKILSKKGLGGVITPTHLDGFKQNLINLENKKKMHYSDIAPLERRIVVISTRAANFAEKSLEDYSEALAGRLTYEGWLSSRGVKATGQRKTHSEFVSQLSACLLAGQLFALLTEDFYRTYQDCIISDPNRFLRNPSAVSFVDYVSEGIKILLSPDKHEKLILKLPENVPDAVVKFGVDKWLIETAIQQESWLKALNYYTITGDINLTFITIVLGLIMSEIDNGPYWNRVCLTLSNFFIHLDEFSKKWKEMTEKIENNFIAQLSRLPVESQEENASIIAGWVNEQMVSAKPMVDILCLGRVIQHLMSDKYYPLPDEEDLSIFFISDLRFVLGAFDPDKCVQSKPSTLAKLEPLEPVKKVSESPPVFRREGPKVKTRGVAAQQDDHDEVADGGVEEDETKVVNSSSWLHGKKVRKLLQDLYGAGFVPVSQRGTHLKLKHSGSGKLVIVPIARDHLPRGTMKSVAEQAGFISLE